jgi:hypothetical protein
VGAERRAVTALGHLPAHEQTIIQRIAAEVGVQPQFLAAIRIAENGGPGREFGVMSTEATTYELQCLICARSIRNNLFRFVVRKGGIFPYGADDHYTDEFIAFMAERWAPNGVANDPAHLNQNWFTNVAHAYHEA